MEIKRNYELRDLNDKVFLNFNQCDKVINVRECYICIGVEDYDKFVEENKNRMSYDFKIAKQIYDEIDEAEEKQKNKLKKYNNEYYQQNKERIKTYQEKPINCIGCKKCITKWNWNKHIKTNKHKRNNIVVADNIIIEDLQEHHEK
jgi:NAD-dependent dihydropyrimidine dehydrogenase PreA subunit